MDRIAELVKVNKWLDILLICAIIVGGGSVLTWNMYLTYQLNDLQTFVHTASTERRAQVAQILVQQNEILSILRRLDNK